MSYFFKILIGVFLFSASSAVGSVFSSSAEAATMVSVSFQNNGNASARVDYDIWGTAGYLTNPGTNVAVGPYGSASVGYWDNYAFPPHNPYYIVWDPVKQEGSDPRDVNCKDPITNIGNTTFDPLTNTDIWFVTVSFACWVPVANNTLNVQSNLGGVPIAGSQGGTGGSTNYTVTMSSDVNTTLTAPSSWNGWNFTGWSGCTSSGNQCFAQVSGGVAYTVTANYSPPVNNQLLVTSNISSVPISGSQGGTGGTTNYTVQMSSDINTTLTAPSSWSGYTFSSWGGCLSLGNQCFAAVSGGAVYSVTANYTSALPTPTPTPIPTPAASPTLTPQPQICHGGTYADCYNTCTATPALCGGENPATYCGRNCPGAPICWFWKICQGENGGIQFGGPILPTPFICPVGTKCQEVALYDGTICIFANCIPVGDAKISGTIFKDSDGNQRLGFSDTNSNGVYDSGEETEGLFNGPGESYNISVNYSTGPYNCAGCPPPPPLLPPPGKVCSVSYTGCVFSCYNDPTFAESFGGVPNCLNWCDAAYCTFPPLDECPNISGDQASVPAGMFKSGEGSCFGLNISKSGANYTISNDQGSSLPYGTYTVSITGTDSGGNPITLTEPGSGSSFTVRAGDNSGCNVGSSLNARCASGSVKDLHFGIAPPDASIVYKSGNNINYTLGDTASFTYTVTNTHPVAVEVGFWPKGSTSSGGSGTFPPSCPGTVGVPATNPPVITVPANTTQDVTFTFVPTLPGGTAYAAVSFGCNPVDANWSNNVSVGQTYNVSAPPAWFQANNGDVGAQLAVSSSASPFGAETTSDYLLAGQTLTNVTTNHWRLVNYTFPQVSPDVYDYMEGRFLERAKAGNNTCDQATLDPTRFNYCSGDVTLSAGLAPGGNTVWFIEGDLTVEGNYSAIGNNTIIFIVKGNITVHTNVDEADGIYVAGWTFRDTDSSGDQGSQLVIDGAVYATGDINLGRVLTPVVLNTTTPAEVINFRAKYIQALNDILGAATITWQEVAP